MLSDDRPLADRSLSQLRSELRQLEQQEQALLQAFPYLEELRNTEPASAEEEELVRLEEGIAEVKLELVKRRETLPKVSGSLLESEPDIVKRRTIISQNQDKSAAELCKLFDYHTLPLLERWCEEFHVREWRAAHRNPKCRKRIDTLISKDKRKIR